MGDKKGQNILAEEIPREPLESHPKIWQKGRRGEKQLQELGNCSTPPAVSEGNPSAWGGERDSRRPEPQTGQPPCEGNRAGPRSLPTFVFEGQDDRLAFLEGIDGVLHRQALQIAGAVADLSGAGGESGCEDPTQTMPSSPSQAAPRDALRGVCKKGRSARGQRLGPARSPTSSSSPASSAAQILPPPGC